MDYEQYKKNIQSNKNATMFARDSYSSRTQTGAELFGDSSFKSYASSFSFNPNLDTPEGLYDIANKVGLKDDADRVLAKAGSDANQFFSGGVISDTMDVLNMLSYGVVGTLKGKGFAEGIKNRESFSDDDALGQYGLAGAVGGFALDILTDPLTYIAPWKAVARIPGVARNAEKLKHLTFGEFKPIDVAGKGFSRREGGWTPLNFLGDKLVYGHAMEKKYLEGIEDVVHRNNADKLELDKLAGQFASLDADVIKKVGEFKADGTFGRVSLEQLQRQLSPDEMATVSKLYKTMDDNADELVRLGALSEEARDRHVGEYLTQVYDEYIDALKQVPGTGSKVSQGSRLKGRLQMTPEERLEMSKDLGQITDMRAVAGLTLIKQAETLANARLQKHVADNFGVSLDDIRQAGDDPNLWHMVPEDKRYGFGKEIAIKQSISDSTNKIRKILKQRRVVVKDNKELVSRLKKIEDELSKMANLTDTQYGEAISGLRRSLREGGITSGPMKKAPTSEGQKMIASEVEAFLKKGSKTDRLARETMPSKDLLREFLSTRGGLALTKAFDDPKKMYQWESPAEFFDAIRYPDKAKVFSEAKDEMVDITDAASDAKIKRTVDAQKKIGALTQEKDVLESTNLKLIDDLMNKIEDDYADELFKKSNLVEQLTSKEFGSLAGKYIPKEVWDVVRGTFDPTREAGEALVMKFKHAKVLWNPASFARNALGASVANWWKLGLGPWNVKTYSDAYKELKTGGKIFQRMEKQGFIPGLGQVQELVDNIMYDKKIQAEIKSQLGSNWREGIRKVKKADKVLGKIYGGIDDVAKVAAFKHGIKQGLSDAEAMKAAYSATFNYSQVTPFVHRMRRAIWGVPFITFSLKAVPLVASTLANNPGRISAFGKARNTLLNAAGVEGEEETEAMPAWMRDDAFMLRLPWKDGEGRSMYFDLTYILPFGSIMTGEYLKNPIGANPVLQTIKELSQNKTFSGYKIFNESDDLDTALADIFVHVSKLGMPPAVAEQFPKGYRENGDREFGTATNKLLSSDLGPSERTLYQEMFRQIGLTVSPYDLDSKERGLKYEQKRQLQQLLVQNGVLNEFTNPYLPKETRQDVLSGNVQVGDSAVAPTVRESTPIGR